MLKTRIVSTGMSVPDRVVTNKDLEKLMDTTDEWIRQRSGIEERRWVEEKDTTLSMATAAAKQAIERANIGVDDIDAIIYGSLFSDYPFPGTGCLLQESLGFKNEIPALDIRNQCSGFLYALSIADAWIKSGMYKRILIVSSEIHSTALDITTRGRDTAVLFGDGAGATIVEASDGPQGIIDTTIHSEGKYAKKLGMFKPSPNDKPSQYEIFKDGRPDEGLPTMDGKFVFKNAVTRMPEALKTICERQNISLDQIDKVIPHQANMRINQMVLKGLGIPIEKAHHTIQKYGNTTMASIPITLHDAIINGKIKEGELLAFVAFGAGFTWGASLIQY